MKSFAEIQLKLLAVLAILFLPFSLMAAWETASDLPHLDDKGRADYEDYLMSGGHKAFAIAPGGAWAWVAEAPSAKAAKQDALEACARNTEQTCVIYASGEEIVFDAEAWARLWGPYLRRAQADAAPVGLKRGERFPNLEFADAGGQPMALSDLRGKTVFLHLWGSWCPPCRWEFPLLEKLVKQAEGDEDIVFILLQVRESFARSRRWVDRAGFRLTLHDSGTKGRDDRYFRVRGGEPIEDRVLASLFPSTYVLDKHGIVIFSKTGPAPGWTDYLPFLRDAASRSGR